MALPLPRVVSDVGPGGGLVTAMGGINSLANNMLLQKINQIKAKYAPLTTQADAASKLAYANLMGPQFLAKIMGNEGAVANLSEDQKRNALRMIYQAGTRQPGMNNTFSNLPQHTGVGQPSTNSISGWVVNKFKNALGQNGPSNNPSFEQSNQMTNPSQTYADSNGRNPAVMAYEAWGKSPEGQRELKKDESANIPDENEVMNWYQNNFQGNPTYAERTGEYKGVVEEGKELGKIRAKAIDELDQQYQAAQQAEVPIDHIIEMTQAPLFKAMRDKIPFFQDKQLNILSKIGTPEQQELIGDFTTTATNAVANTINSFRGRILDKEITMANQMKISPKDTFNTILGKLSSIKTFNEMTKERTRITSELISKEHLNRGEALEKADKMINGKAIRQQVENQLHPISDEDIDFTAREMGMTREQVIKRLRAEGRYNG